MKVFDSNAKDPAVFFDDPFLQQNALAMDGVSGEVVRHYRTLASNEHYTEIVSELYDTISKNPNPKLFASRLKAVAFFNSALSEVSFLRTASKRAGRLHAIYRYVSQSVENDPTYVGAINLLDTIYKDSLKCFERLSNLPDRDDFDFSPLIDNKKAYDELRVRAQKDLERCTEEFKKITASRNGEWVSQAE